MEGGRSLPFPARGCPHVTLGLYILITVRDLTGELARATDVPNVAAAPVGDAPCCAKSIDDEARAEVPVSDWCRCRCGWGGGAWSIHRGGLDLFKGALKYPPPLNFAHMQPRSHPAQPQGHLRCVSCLSGRFLWPDPNK